MVIRDIGCKVRLGRRDEVHDRRHRRRLRTEPMLRKCRYAPEPAALRERDGADCTGAKASCWAGQTRRWQQRGAPIFDSVVVDA